MRRIAAVLLALTVLASWSIGAHAGSLDTMGVSSRGTAMGGAMVSIANGWDATYYNPSALALSRKSTSVQVSLINGKMMQNETDMCNDLPLAKFGYNTRFLRNRIGLGLILGSAATAGSGDMIGDLTGGLMGGGPPNWNWDHYIDGGPSPVLTSFGLGFRVADWLAVGFSINQKDSMISVGYFPFAVDSVLEQLLGIATGAIPANVEGMDFGAGGDPSDDYASGFNVTFRPLKYISLGYVYKPEAWSRYKFRVELVGGGGSILPESQYILIDMKVPGQVETTIYGGAGSIPFPWNDGLLTLAYAREIQNWDGFFPQSTQYQWTASDTFNSEWFTSKIARDPKLKDVAFDRFGIEYEGDATPLMFWKLKMLANPRFSVRGGYYHWDSPQGAVTEGWQLGMVDSDADVYSFGAGFGYDRRKSRSAFEHPLFVSRIQIDLHVQITELEDRTYRLQTNEWGNVPLTNYHVETEGSITNIGVQITWLN